MNALRGIIPTSLHRKSRFLAIPTLSCLLAVNLTAQAQYTWTTGGLNYATRGEAEEALRSHPQYQWAPLLEHYYTEQQWQIPGRTIYWYSVLDYQQVSASELHGYSLSGDCGFFDGINCHDTIQDAVDSSYSQSSICDITYSIGREFRYSDVQWKAVLEHGVQFWGRETAPIELDFYYWSADGQSCNYGSSFSQSIHRTWLATCDSDLKPANGNFSQWSNPPVYPDVCSTNGREPPQSNLALISRRTTAVCTATEGNPCSPMTGNKLLSETDYSGNYLSVQRQYHSGLESSSGTMGPGWTHNYDSILLAGDDYTLIAASGTRERFKATSTGSYRSLIRPGTLLTLSGDRAQILFEGGRKEVYEKILPLKDEPSRYHLVETYTPDLPDRPLSLAYDDRGLLTGVVDQHGRQLVFDYDDNFRVSTIYLPDDQSLRYAYDSTGNLTSVTFQDGSQRFYHYENTDLPNHLTGITDENGQRYANYEFDVHARVTSSEHANGAGRVELHYEQPGDTRVTTPSGDVRAYEFDPAGTAFEVNQINDGRGTTTYARNITGWVEQRTDSLGNTTHFSYDDHHMISETRAAGTPEERTRSFAWDSVSNRTTMIDEPGAVTHFEYDAVGRLTSKVIRDKETGMERAWEFSYYPDDASGALSGRLYAIDGPRTDASDVTYFEYYSNDDPLGRWMTGDLRIVRNAIGHVTEILEYELNGRPLVLKDPNQVLTRLGYHPRGWLVSQTRDGIATRFSYDPAGNLTRIDESDGSFVAFRYDQAHRLVAVSDNLGNRIEYSLDSSGHRTGEQIYDPLGNLRHQLTRDYDTLGRMRSLVRGLNGEVRFDYDAMGNTVSSIDANLNETVYRYDALNRPVSVIDPNSQETLLLYDERGNLSRVTDPNGAVTGYLYDGFDNPVEIASADAGEVRHEYDTAGNRISTIDGNGHLTRYDYDELNRLTWIRHGNSSLDVEFTYDQGIYGVGQLTSISDAVGKTEFGYDAGGNLVSETRTIGELDLTASYEYNAAGKLRRVIYPSGMQIDYGLDAIGHVTSISQTIGGQTRTLASNIVREPFGPVRAFEYGNGRSYRATHDLAYMPRSIESGEDLKWDLELDAVGNVLALNNRLDGLPIAHFEYDALRRLTSARGEFGQEQYGYDANGNRLSALEENTLQEYFYDPESNRLVSHNGFSMQRDAAGNRSSRTDRRGLGTYYDYGDDNRLSRIYRKDADGEVVLARFQYDARGRRVIKGSDDGKTYFVYGLSGELIGEYDLENHGVWTEYIYLQGFPLAVVTRSAKKTSPPGRELILDDGDSGTTSSGSWRHRTNGDAYHGDYLYAGKAAGATFRWAADPPGERNRIYAWWPDKNNLSDTVEYTISHGAGLTEAVIRNQKAGGGQWQLLGTFDRSVNSNFVEVSSAKNRFIADAVRWEQVTEPVIEWTVTTGFIHFDHLGAPFSVTDDHQTEIWRWPTSPFGSALPETDPDGDGEELTLNLRFPGQYFDKESGLFYNYFRHYDPDIGRYLESDPIGLRGGLNPFVYALNAPTTFIDPLGLKITGQWIKPPRFNLVDYGVTGAEFITPHLSEWAYLKAFRIHGFAEGYVNVDVNCSESSDCLLQEWEIHERINVSYTGHVDIGPNMAAAAVGSAATPAAGVATGIVTLGGSALSSLLVFLREVQSRGGDKIRWLYEVGPTALCMGTQE